MKVAGGSENQLKLFARWSGLRGYFCAWVSILPTASSSQWLGNKH
ncbi:MAG: hypothetical protein ABIN69_16310 [Aestuariivirga sp.]